MPSFPVGSHVLAAADDRAGAACACPSRAHLDTCAGIPQVSSPNKEDRFPKLGPDLD